MSERTSRPKKSSLFASEAHPGLSSEIEQALNIVMTRDLCLKVESSGLTEKLLFEDSTIITTSHYRQGSSS